MSSYYNTPPPTSGSHWSQPIFPRPSSTAYQQGTPHIQPTHNQSPYASLVMQQLQNYSYNVSHPQKHAQAQQLQQSVFEQPKMPTPQAADNALLAQVLYEQTKRGLTYKAALESLHGHNGIMAYAWKDYFLENKQTIDALVNQLAGQAPESSPVTSQRSPSPNLKNGIRRSASSDRSRSQSRSRTKSERDVNHRVSEERLSSMSRTVKSKESTPARGVKIKKDKATNGKSKHRSKERGDGAASRRTLNSLSSAPSNDLLAKVPAAVAIDKHTGLPAAPSRSPSPPASGPNSRYTEQDTIFFFRRIAYDLARDPDLSKARLCDLLGEKAPHHSALSWRTFWHKHEDVVDKMYLLTQLDEEDREKAIQSWKGGVSVSGGAATPRSAARSRRISYKESSDSDLSVSDVVSLSSGSDSESSGTSDDDDGHDSSDDEDQLGEAGSSFTVAEQRVLAKHIANLPEWFNGHRKWESFFAAYPQRTPAAWREFYRRKSDEINALARKYGRKAKKTNGAEISKQRGRPSWARPGSRAESTGPIKRKLSEVSRDHSEEKRSRKEDLC